MTKASAIAEAERLVLHALEAHESGAINMSASEFIEKLEFKQRLDTVDWQMYVHSADFVARVLLDHHIDQYGLFCGQQCVENYLKSFLHKEASRVPQSHNLMTLLDDARKLSASDRFLNSRFAESICRRFDPFYELPRYPVQNRGPAGGMARGTGIDIQFLDYFVYRMRRSLVDPIANWDILSAEGHYHLQMATNMRPEVITLFKANNINFM